MTSPHKSPAYDNDISSPQGTHRSYTPGPGPYLSPICQYDGIDDTLLDTPLPVTSKPVNDVGIPKRVRVAPYTMDRKKQLSKLANDASIDDFEIVVSPNEHNVTIYCSTGFYFLVAIPAFSDISVGSSFPVLSMTASCYDITGKVDSSHANVNTVFFFRVSNDAKSSIAKVTVHLHHTARKVQVQGGSLVDKKRAGIWFLQHFLLQSFFKIAKDKALDITKFNNAVKGIVTNHVEKVGRQDKCYTCDIPFTGRSLRQVCTVCKEKFHKTCLQSDQHLCLGAGPSDHSPGQPRSQAQAAQQSVIFVPAPGPTTPSITPSAPPPTLPAQSLSRITISPTTLPLSSGPPTISTTSPSLFSNRNPALNVVTTPATSLQVSQVEASSLNDRAPKKKSQTLTMSREDIDMEYAKAEIKTLKAKLKEHETSVKDLKFQNSILLERISALEKPRKQSLFEKYFPSSSPQSSSGPAPNPPSCWQAPSCLRPPACYSSPCQSTCNVPAAVLSKLENIENSVNSLANILRSTQTEQSVSDAGQPLPSAAPDTLAQQAPPARADQRRPVEQVRDLPTPERSIPTPHVHRDWSQQHPLQGSQPEPNLEPPHDPAQQPHGVPGSQEDVLPSLGQHEARHDSMSDSQISIDDFMPSLTDEQTLNCHLQTTRLDQLRQ